MSSSAQKVVNVYGKIKNDFGQPLFGIVIKLHGEGKKYSATTDLGGNYGISGVLPGKYVFKTNYSDSILYYSYVGDLCDDSIQNIPDIILHYVPNSLAEVVIRSPPVIIKEDTIQFNTASYHVQTGAMVDELIKKLPGIQVTGGGIVTFQGQPIAKVQLNGRDFLGGDVLAAIQNLPADVIGNIQIIDDYGDQARLTGVKYGESQKVINLSIRRERKKSLSGNIAAGIGSDATHIVSATLNRFVDEQQISLLATSNNTGLNTNITGYAPESINIGNGAASTNSFGLNYTDSWSKRLSVYGSYSVSNKTIKDEGNIYKQDLNLDYTRATNQNNINTSKIWNHQVDWNMEYNLDTVDYFKFSATSSFKSAEESSSSFNSLSQPLFFTSSHNRSSTKNNGSDWSVRLTYNHKFKKKRRNFNISIATNMSFPDDHIWLNSEYTNIDSARIDSNFSKPYISSVLQQRRQADYNHYLLESVNLSYIEPLFKHTVVDLNCNYDVRQTYNAHYVYDIDTITGFDEILNPSLTNQNRLIFTTARYAVNIQTTTLKYTYLIGALLEPSSLRCYNESAGRNTEYTAFNWTPTARLIYHASRLKTLTILFNGYSHEPDLQKLQPVIDSSNLSNIIIGNPDLRPEFKSRISISYNASNKQSGSLLFANLSIEHTKNKIVNSVVNDVYSTSQTTTFVNVEPFYYISGNISYSKPFANRTFNASLSLAGNFGNSFSYTDYRRNNGKNWSLRPGFKLRLDLPDLIDASLSVNYVQNSTTTNYTDRNLTVEAQSAFIGADGKLYILKYFTLGWNYSKVFNYGYAGGINTSPDILNLFVEYCFLKGKMATIRLQSFDLLNQNTRLSHTVNGTTIIDSRYNGLMRYFLLSLSFRLSHVTF